MREIEVMKTVQHQNVLKLIEFYDGIDYPEAVKLLIDIFFDLI